MSTSSLTRAALAVKSARGERVGSVPYGCRLAADGVHLEDDADELAVMAAARELRAAGLSLRKVGAAMEARGMLPRSGGRWHTTTVARVLARTAAYSGALQGANMSDDGPPAA